MSGRIVSHRQHKVDHVILLQQMTGQIAIGQPLHDNDLNTLLRVIRARPPDLIVCPDHTGSH
jgi:hypothetical protein